MANTELAKSKTVALFSLMQLAEPCLRLMAQSGERSERYFDAYTVACRTVLERYMPEILERVSASEMADQLLKDALPTHPGWKR